MMKLGIPILGHLQVEWMMDIMPYIGYFSVFDVILLYVTYNHICMYL